jgi:hypothetical protein
MKIFCVHCGLNISKSQDLLILENEKQGTSLPIKCQCGAKGFVTFMTANENNIITVQLVRKI